jgi:hypothetical protein
MLAIYSPKIPIKMNSNPNNDRLIISIGAIPIGKVFHQISLARKKINPTAKLNTPIAIPKNEAIRIGTTE